MDEVAARITAERIALQKENEMTRKQARRMEFEKLKQISVEEHKIINGVGNEEQMEIEIQVKNRGGERN